MDAIHKRSIRTNVLLRMLLQASVGIAALAGLQGCMRYLTHDRTKVLLAGVDIDQTLKIAAMEIDKGTLGCVLAGC